jgi:hypothetical protein
MRFGAPPVRAPIAMRKHQSAQWRCVSATPFPFRTGVRATSSPYEVLMIEMMEKRRAGRT